MSEKNKGKRGGSGDSHRTTRKANPIAEKAKSRLNPPEQTALKAGSKRGVASSSGVVVGPARPMPPAPPMGVASPIARGCGTTLSGPERPKSPYVLELEEKASKAAANPAMQRICEKCGGTKMIKVKRNARNEIIAMEACPKCVDCKEA